MNSRFVAATLVTASAAVLVGCGSSSAKPPAPPAATAAEPQKAPTPVATPLGSVVAVGDTPEGLVVDDRTGLAIAALRNPDSLAFVQLAGDHAVRRVATPGRARHLRLQGPGGPLLLPAEDTDKLVEVALPSGKVISSVATRRQPHDAVAAGGRIWITDELAGTVTSLGAVGRTLPAGLQPGGLAAAGGRVASADVRGNKLYVFDATSQQQVAVLEAGAGPTHVVQVNATMVAVADTRGDAVLLYALDGTPRLLTRIPLAGGPYGLAADPDRKRLWVALSGRNELVRFDVRGEQLVQQGKALPTVQQPNSVAVNAATGAVVVAGAIPAGVVEFLPASG